MSLGSRHTENWEGYLFAESRLAVRQSLMVWMGVVGLGGVGEEWVLEVCTVV